jgi:hypothetical protein
MQSEMKSERKGHYVCTYLDDWQAACLTHAIIASLMTDDEKKKLLGSLLAQLFPTL